MLSVVGEQEPKVVHRDGAYTAPQSPVSSWVALTTPIGTSLRFCVPCWILSSVAADTMLAMSTAMSPVFAQCLMQADDAS